MKLKENLGRIIFIITAFLNGYIIFFDNKATKDFDANINYLKEFIQIISYLF